MGSKTNVSYDRIEREEELKNRVAKDFFNSYDCTRVIKNIDFSVYPPTNATSDEEIAPYFWAEAKKQVTDIYEPIAQLILTIGKDRLFDKYLPPIYVGAFNAKKIAFVPYNHIQHLFDRSDINWKVPPSNHETSEFRQVLNEVKAILDNAKEGPFIFDFEEEEEDLRTFIRENFQHGRKEGVRIRIDRDNFIIIYQRWCEVVRPTIKINWDLAKQKGIIDADFYLADLLSQDNNTVMEKLSVTLKQNHYELGRHKDDMGLESIMMASFKDGQAKYREFWAKYERPPKKEDWDYIIERRDLLVSQDIRERKGSFFTPQIWVELSQVYLAKALGQNWQDEYYIWDCAAGTGNLLSGLKYKDRIWASTLDEQDVGIMRQRIKNGANLLEKHVFQFDFLNDDWKPELEQRKIPDKKPELERGKIPDNLYVILHDSQKRAKLVIYINPPYAEATTARTVSGTGRNKPGVASDQKAHKMLQPKIGNAANELFALFMGQVYEKIPNCILALFSTPKFIQGYNFQKFRQYFRAKYLGGFMVPAYTFDNVRGKFPICFTIWDLKGKETIQRVACDVYDEKGHLLGEKVFYGDLPKSINKWIVRYRPSSEERVIGYLSNYPPDFQNQNKVFIQNHPTKRSGAIGITASNLIQVCVYFAVRHCIRATWINDRDQFLWPQDEWENDQEFQADCVIFTLFHSQNRISGENGQNVEPDERSAKVNRNHWIPFKRGEVGAQAAYKSDFMERFLEGKWGDEPQAKLLAEEGKAFPILHKMSKEAKKVYEAGKALWRYYHTQPAANPDASLYDIRAYFQGCEKNGEVKKPSEDNTYLSHNKALKKALAALAQKIAEKAYLYRFLRR